MAMAPMHKTNREDAIKTFTKPVSTYTQHKNKTGERKDLRWLWPTTHKTNPKGAQTQTFNLQNLGTLTRHNRQARERQDLRWLWPPTHRTNQKMQKPKH